jgi:predicted enzyme related to lactoylglutathione lyase
MGKGKIVGIGGIFFKCDDPKETKNWYAENLDVKTDQWGASFVTKQYTSDKSSYLQWSPFPKDSKYFGDSDQAYMINYRVKNIESLVADLKQKGVVICDKIESFDYGKFVHIKDNNGVRMELWEPVDKVFDEMNQDKSNLNIE